MPSGRMWAGLTLLLAFAAGVRAQVAAYETTVAVPEVEVRCGPSTQFYATSKLRLGARVKVVEEKDGGWLAIEPPEGSFSWIEARLLGNLAGRVATVMVPEAPVRAGSALQDRSPDVVSTKLLQGAQVVILGEGKVADDGSKWLPIEAQKEYRYIPKTAVKTPVPVESLTTAKPAAPVPGAPAAAAPNSPEALWQQAEQAYAAGNIAEARRLYQLCSQQPNVETKLIWWCHSRLDSLAQLPAQPPARPTTVTLVPPVAPPPGNSTPAPVPSSGQASGYSPRPTTPGGTAASPGFLRRAGFQIDGKQAYALTDSSGRLVMYVTDQGNVNLEQWLGRSVNLTGTIAYHGQLKRDYMLATGVAPLSNP